MEREELIRSSLAAYLRSKVANLVSNFDPTILTASLYREEILVTDNDVKNIWVTMKPELIAKINKLFH